MLATLVNFVTGGGLLALVQAALVALSQYQARKDGATSTVAATDTKVIANDATAAQVDSEVNAMPSATVSSELRQFDRD